MKLKELVKSLEESLPYKMISVVGDKGWKMLLYRYRRSKPIVLNYFDPIESSIGCIVRELKISSEGDDYGLTINVKCYKGGRDCEILLASLISKTIQSTHVIVYLYKESLYRYAESKLNCDDNDIKIQSHLFSLGSVLRTKKEKAESCDDLTMCVSKCIDFLVKNFGKYVIEYLKDLDYIRRIFTEKEEVINIIYRTLKIGVLYNLYP